MLKMVLKMMLDMDVEYDVEYDEHDVEYGVEYDVGYDVEHEEWREYEGKRPVLFWLLGSGIVSKVLRKGPFGSSIPIPVEQKTPRQIEEKIKSKFGDSEPLHPYIEDQNTKSSSAENT